MARSSKTSSLSRVAEHLPLDVEAIAARVDAVLNDGLYWFPVRHHSATVARHVETAIFLRRPKVVFIEGPSEATDLIPHIVDRRTKPPIAIYSSYRDDDNLLGLAGIASPSEEIPPRFSCWYPLVDYSPEYVAMKAAAKVGAAVVFIDLPHYAQIRPANIGRGTESPESETSESNAESHTLEREDEALICDSDFYRQLATVAGFRSWNEGWDSLFEFGRLKDDVEEFRREMATFCAAARATSSSDRIAGEGTLERERCMWQTIQRRLTVDRWKPEEAFVVCGGFHLFLNRADETPPPEPPAGTTYQTVVPYSYFRMSELSGYAAGNRAPQFYGMHWDAIRGKLDDLSAEYIIGVLKRARRRGDLLSSADAISVTQHARMLGALRGRPVPVLDDLRDALITCCCKGDPRQEGVYLLRAIDESDIGTKIGRVTPDLDRMPIVDDFHRHLEDLQLDVAMQREKRIRIDLDKRDELDARRSAFLHRLMFLEIPLCTQAEAPSKDFATGLIFREKWAIRWSPDVVPELVEQNLYGDTVESAVLAKLREVIAKDGQHAGRTCARLVQAVDMDLPDLIREVQADCSTAIDEDSRFPSLSEALGHLTVIDRYAVYRELKRDVLADLIVRCFNKACFAIIDVIAVPEDQQPQVVDGLLSLAEIVLRGNVEGIDGDLFAEHVRAAADETNVPFLRGMFLGLLAEMRVVSADELASEISALAKSSQDKLATAGELLHGILTASRTSILLGARALIAAIDELLSAAEWEPFLTMLPRIRAAFEQLHGRQRESVALTVAEHYGLKETESLTELRTSAAGAVRIAELDRRVASIMQNWEY